MIAIISLPFITSALDDGRGNIVHNTGTTYLDLTNSYNVYENTVFRRVYTTGTVASVAKVRTNITLSESYEVGAMAVIYGTDGEYVYNYSDVYNSSTGTVTSGVVRGTTQYASRTEHFGEAWDGYDLLYYWDLIYKNN